MKNSIPGNISVADLFTYPTIKRLAGYIRQNIDKGANDIVLKSLPMPEEYFIFGGELFEDTEYSFEIHGPVFKRLVEISGNEAAEISDILLALFVYLLNQVSEQETVPVNTIYCQENRIQPLEIDFEPIENISALIREVGSMARNYSQAGCHVDEACSSISYRENNMVRPLFYRKELLVTSARLSQTFDIILAVGLESEGINISFEYDASRLDRERMSEFVMGYKELINTFSKVREPGNEEKFN
jgi:hypothetical protein